MVSDLGSAPLAAIHYQRGFDIDELLSRSCAQLRSVGVRIGGVLQQSSGEQGQCASLVHVVDLRSGRTFNIWEDRGACAVGCRLDERGLVDAESALMGALADGVDLLVINRFGRAESLGRGLLGCFSAAIEAGVAVLTAVRPPYDQAWYAFHGGCAHDLAPEMQEIIDWALTSTARSPPHLSQGQAASIRDATRELSADGLL
jgi:molybdate transport system ATP-binding protein